MLDFLSFEDFCFQPESGTNSNDFYFIRDGDEKAEMVKIFAF